MAVDSAAKRYSIANFGNGDLLLPIPDGTLAAVDMAHLLGLYSGITLTAIPTTPGLEFTLPANRMHFGAEENRLHFTLPVDRMHFAAEEEN